MKWLIVLFLALPAYAQWSGGVVSGGTITFGASVVVCGPPTYPCSLNSSQVGGKAIIQNVATPNVGNLTGIGTVVTPSDFSNPVCRMSDASFDPSLANANIVADAGGSGDETLSNTDSSLWIIGNPNGRGYPINVAFNGSTCTVNRLYASNPSWTSTGGFYIAADDPGWSYTNKYLLFILDPVNPAIDSYNFAGFAPTGTPPSPATVFDFRQGQTGSWGTTSANCLASSYPTGGWSSYGKQNKYPTANVDTIHAAAFSNAYVVHSSAGIVGMPTFLETFTQATTGATIVFHEMAGNNLVGNQYSGGADTTHTWTGGTSGATLAPNSTGVTVGGQGTGTDAVAYKVGSGCSHLDTATGTVTGDFGTTGAITGTASAERFTIHQLKISKSGVWAMVASQVCLLGPCTSLLPYFWKIGTTELDDGCTTGNGCGGHWTEGELTFFNNSGTPKHFQEVTRLYTAPTSFTNVPMGLPWNGVDCARAVDQHPNWSNVDINDTLPVVTSTYDGDAPTGQAPFTCVMEDEIIAINPVSGLVWRFAHTYNTDQSQTFSTNIAIGGVSQDGNFYIWSSDWLGTLGSSTGGSTCTVGVNCRGDVFMVKLN